MDSKIFKKIHIFHNTSFEHSLFCQHAYKLIPNSERDSQGILNFNFGTMIKIKTRIQASSHV